LSIKKKQFILFRKHFIAITKTILLMTFKEIVAVCETHKHRMQGRFRAMEMYAAAWGLKVRERRRGSEKAVTASTFV
jgi:hypothetical protein